jgi:imidazolonepropionase
LIKNLTDSAAPTQRLLIRRVRQLLMLRGPSGPRRGAALRDLQIVNDGALLIHNGVIEECGAAQRIENLRTARGAREIDAFGKIVMPAFVDPDAALVFSPPRVPRAPDEPSETPLRKISKRRLEAAVIDNAAAWVRHGVLTVGAHTGHARDFRETAKILRLHRNLQERHLRVRSIFSPRVMPDLATLLNEWLPVIRQKKLAPILELSIDQHQPPREIASAAASLGYSLRLRSSAALEQSACAIAAAAGAVAIIAPLPRLVEYAARLLETSCVQILPLFDMAAGEAESGIPIRDYLDRGAALALASCYRPRTPSSFNPQYLLYLAERAGFTPEEAISASTWNAACSLRISSAAGSLEPGKAADLLVMDVPDYRELSRRPGHSDVQLVFRAGHAVYVRGGLSLD